MAKIISPTQPSFQQNRPTADNAIIVKILSHFKRKSCETSYILLKLDLEKVFDRIEWSFVRQALQYFNFPLTIIKLIMSCVTTTFLSILIKHTFFQSHMRSSTGRSIIPVSLYIMYGITH